MHKAGANTVGESGPDRRASPLLREAVDRFMLAVHRRAVSSSTIRMKRRSLLRFVSFCEARRIEDSTAATADLIHEFAVSLHAGGARRDGRSAAGLSPSTRALILSAVRDLFAWLVRNDEILLNPAASLDLPFVSRGLPGVASATDVVALLEAVDPESAEGLRDRAVLEIVFGCGLRRGELVALDVTDLDLEKESLVVRRGKGGTSRAVPLVGEALAAVSLYVARGRPELARTVHEPALFVSRRGLRFHPEGLAQRLEALVRRAGFRRRITFHALRHGYATALLKGGADAASVQALLGHARLDTTERYTHLVLTDVIAAYRRAHPRERRGRRHRARRPVF